MPFRYYLYRSVWLGVDFLYPPVCGGCGEKGTRWCSDCQRSVQFVSDPKCDICGLPQSKSGICSACRQNLPAYQALRSWAVFSGPVRKALHSIKYRQDLGLEDILAANMLEFVKGLGWEIDFVLPVPLGKKRYKERGYNQVGLIAFALALANGWKYAPHYLKRVRETSSQVGLSAGEREKNVDDAFLANREKVAGKSVLVIDDVSTTGATLNSCAKALISGGARGVYALSIARALPRHGLKTV